MPVLWKAPPDAQGSRSASSILRRVWYAAELAWSPVDAVLGVRSLSNLIVVTVTLSVAVLTFAGGGFERLLINLPSLAVIWGASYGLIRLGRWWRGAYPPAHAPRPVRVRGARPARTGRRA
jgi:hypothetical protein